MTGEVAVDIDKHTRDGSQLFQEGELAKAKQQFELAFRAAQQSGDGFTERACAFNLGAVFITLQQPERGLEMLQRAIPPMNKRDGKSNGDLYYNFGLGYELLNNDADAVKYFELAYDEYRIEKENVRMEIETTKKAASLYCKLTRPLQAARCYGIAASGLAQVQDFIQQSLCLCKQAQNLLLARRYKEAVLASDDCMLLCQRIDSQHILGRLYSELGLIYSQCHDFPKAATCFEFALPLNQGPTVERTKQAIILQNLGAVYNSLGEYQRALSFHERAAALHADLGDRSSQGQCFINLAFAYAQLADKDSAGECYLHALQAGKDTGEKQTQWQALEGLGAVAYHSDNIDKAVSYFKQALATLASSGHESNMAQERLVMKLTDALQIQLSKKSSVDPRNVRPPSARSVQSSGMPIQAVQQAPVQMGVPPTQLTEMPRPSSRLDPQPHSELRVYQQRHRMVSDLVLGMGGYQTDEDISLHAEDTESALPQVTQSRPSSSMAHRQAGATPLVRPASVPEQQASRPPAMAAVREEPVAEQLARSGSTTSSTSDYSKYRTGRRMSRQAHHVHGMSHEDYNPQNLLRRPGKQPLLRTDTHDSQREWEIEYRPDKHSAIGCFAIPGRRAPEEEYHERLGPTTEEDDEPEEPARHQQNAPDKRKIMRMIKGGTSTQSHEMSSDEEANSQYPKPLGTHTREVVTPGQNSSYSRQTTGETEESHELDEQGTGDSHWQEYQKRIRRISRNDDLNGDSAEESGTEEEEEDESDTETEDNRPSSSEEFDQGDGQSRTAKLKTTIEDPNDPDYQTIRTLKLNGDQPHQPSSEEDASSDGSNQRSENNYQKQPSTSTDAPPALPPRPSENYPRTFGEMSTSEQHDKRERVTLDLGKRYENEATDMKRSSKTCVVM